MALAIDMHIQSPNRINLAITGEEASGWAKPLRYPRRGVMCLDQMEAVDTADAGARACSTEGCEKARLV